MFIIVGLILLLAAVVVGIAGVLTNAGAPHLLTDQFAVLGYHVTGSTGTVFLCGVVVGAVAGIGFSMLLASTWRAAGRDSGREPKRSEHQMHSSKESTASDTAALHPRPVVPTVSARTDTRSANADDARQRPQLVSHLRGLFPGRGSARDQQGAVQATVKQ